MECHAMAECDRQWVGISESRCDNVNDRLDELVIFRWEPFREYLCESNGVRFE
jgi:hypothetical protein